MRKIHFDENQIHSIILLYKNGLSSEKICLLYNVSASTICQLLKDNNIKLIGNKKNLNESEIISMYLSNSFKMSEICERFQVSKLKIRKVLLSNNIKSKSSKKYNYYDDVFETIDTEEKSYWLGFLFADGYVRKRKSSSELKLKLSAKDKEHLLKFKKFISPDDIPVPYEECINKSKNGKLYNNSKSFKISIHSIKIVDDLIDKGCFNKKTKIIQFPNFLETSLVPHFIRGYFDGDGSISFTNKYIGLNFVSGSINFLKSLSNKLESEANCKNANLTGRSKNFKYIQFSSKDDLYKLYNYFYKNSSIYMDRKKEKYTYIIGNFNELRSKINIYRKVIN